MNLNCGTVKGVKIETCQNPTNRNTQRCSIKDTKLTHTEYLTRFTCLTCFLVKAGDISTLSEYGGTTALHGTTRHDTTRRVTLHSISVCTPPVKNVCLFALTRIGLPIEGVTGYLSTLASNCQDRARRLCGTERQTSSFGSTKRFTRR